MVVITSVMVGRDHLGDGRDHLGDGFDHLGDGRVVITSVMDVITSVMALITLVMVVIISVMVVITSEMAVITLVMVVITLIMAVITSVMVVITLVMVVITLVMAVILKPLSHRFMCPGYEPRTVDKVVITVHYLFQMDQESKKLSLDQARYEHTFEKYKLDTLHLQSCSQLSNCLKKIHLKVLTRYSKYGPEFQISVYPTLTNTHEEHLDLWRLKTHIQ